jgi:uncharacterized membrane protein YuzA (DUF378 family)
VLEVPFDWKRLERDDQERDYRAALVLGVSWTAIGTVGTLVLVVIGRTDRLLSSVFFLLVGLLGLAIALTVRRRDRKRRTRGSGPTSPPG